MNAMREPAAVDYSQIPYVPRRHLWEPYVPVGIPVIYAAAGGTGKGMLWAAVVARAVLGLPYPGEDQEARREPQRAVWITGQGEDDQYEDLAPRLRAAIASAAAEFGQDAASAAAAIALVSDLSEWPDGTPVTLPADCARLAGELAEMNADERLPPVGVVVADSLSALLSDGFTIDSRQGARRVLGRLARLARDADVALALLHHTTKDGKVAGSAALLDGVRLAFRIEADADKPNVRTIIRHKSNGAQATPQQYVIAGGGPAAHAVFTSAEDAREARRPRRAPQDGDRSGGPGTFRARLASLARRDPTEAEPGRYRCLARAQSPGKAVEAGRIVADRVSAEDGRAAAARDAGRPLDWQTAPSGMRVATITHSDGTCVSYGVYVPR